MDPVYGAIFSRVFLNEQLGLQGYLGAGLILIAIYISNTYSSDSSSDSSGSGSGSGSGKNANNSDSGSGSSDVGSDKIDSGSGSSDLLSLWFFFLLRIILSIMLFKFQYLILLLSYFDFIK